MGPNTNPELYVSTAFDIQPVLDEEYIRRNLVAPALAELSVLFHERDNTPCPVIEPTLFARLYALSMVQRSRMGISGFYPLDTFRYGGQVDAKAAPSHDEFVTSNSVFRTRVINFVMPDRDATDRDIEIFGINFYQPAADEDTPDKQPTRESTGSGIIVVDKRGIVTNKRSPISGETVIFAVHNKVTHDAKLYQVTLEKPNNMDPQTVDSAITLNAENCAQVSLPDSRRVNVTQL